MRRSDQATQQSGRDIVRVIARFGLDRHLQQILFGGCQAHWAQPLVSGHQSTYDRGGATAKAATGRNMDGHTNAYRWNGDMQTFET